MGTCEHSWYGLTIKADDINKESVASMMKVRVIPAQVKEEKRAAAIKTVVKK